jgi:FkbM family methyltransferase
VALEKGGLRGAPTILSKLSERRVFRDRVATVRLPGGQRIAFPAYDPYWCRYLYAGKPYEPDVERIFRRIGKGRVLIDCGANIGYWSVRHKDFGFTRSIAIEANPALLPFLRLNHSGEIHERAVYSVSGEQLVFSGDGACGHLGTGFKTDADDRSVTVETLALSDVKVSEPAVVKLDVEGAEIPAIEGLGEMDAILVYEDFPRQGMKVTRYLLAKGWKLFSQTMEPVTSVEQVSADLGRGIPHNLIASRTPLAL